MIKKVIGVAYKNKIRHRLVASVFQCGKIALVVYDMRVSVLQGGFEPILKYKLRAPSDWGMQNVKFHDSVYTTPFSRTQTKSFLMIYLRDNWYLYDCI